MAMAGPMRPSTTATRTSRIQGRRLLGRPAENECTVTSPLLRKWGRRRRNSIAESVVSQAPPEREPYFLWNPAGYVYIAIGWGLLAGWNTVVRSNDLPGCAGLH